MEPISGYLLIVFNGNVAYIDLGFFQIRDDF